MLVALTVNFVTCTAADYKSSAGALAGAESAEVLPGTHSKPSSSHPSGGPPQRGPTPAGADILVTDQYCESEHTSFHILQLSTALLLPCPQG